MLNADLIVEEKMMFHFGKIAMTEKVLGINMKVDVFPNDQRRVATNDSLSF